MFPCPVSSGFTIVDVAFKLFIDNIELVDKLFKLLNIVVEVLLELLIDNTSNQKN